MTIRRIKKLILLTIMASLGVYYSYGNLNKKIVYPDGETANEVPFQKNYPNTYNYAFSFDDYKIAVLAKFIMDARVLSKERYAVGAVSKLAPYDLAMGWQKMSDQVNLREIDISQSGRWYRYRKSNKSFLSYKEISDSSANMHIIPANKNVLDALKRVEEGDFIHLEGKLVEVSAKNGMRWRSSLTRFDSGNGSCEVVYVEEFKIIEKNGRKISLF